MKPSTRNNQHMQHLVGTEWLEQNLNNPALRLFDCTVNVIPNPDTKIIPGQHRPFIFQSGRDNYQQGHIPGAGFIDILGELTDKSSNLPLMMPSEKQFIDAMSQYGIGEDSHVILYCTGEPNWAARAWWMLYSHGFNNVSILNGGWKKWVLEGRSVSNEESSYQSDPFISNPRSGCFVDKSAVLAAINDSDTLTINALPSPLHKGTSDFFFGRKGSITGSVNLPFVDLHHSESGEYLSTAELRQLFNSIDVNSASQMIAYCGGGIASANTAFALHMLGYENVAVYDGSMLEWGNDDSLPIQIGEPESRQ